MVIYVMFVVGMSLTRVDFERLTRNTSVILLGTLGPFLLLPAFAIALVTLLDFAPYIETGILLISICPGGGISNFYTYLAKANTALSVSMTGISSILAIVMLPILMMSFVALGLETQAFEVPFSHLLGQLIVTLVLPILAGMWVRSRFIKFSSTNELRFRVSSIAVVVFLTVFILAQGPAATTQEWIQIVFISVLFCFIAMTSGVLIGRLAGLNRSDRFCLMVEYAVQNVGIAVVIAVTMIGNVKFATMAAIYVVVQLPIIAVSILKFRLAK
jgi:BASS family bile acid:Na+ symporter